MSKLARDFATRALRGKIQGAVFSALAANGATVEHIAKRLGRTPKQIEALLNVPERWTLDDVSDLLLSVRCELRMTLNKEEMGQ